MSMGEFFLLRTLIKNEQYALFLVFLSPAVGILIIGKKLSIVRVVLIIDSCYFFE